MDAGDPADHWACVSGCQCSRSGLIEKAYGYTLLTGYRSPGSVPFSNGNCGRFDSLVAGEYTGDVIVEDRVIVEVKVVGALSDVHAGNAETIYGQPYACLSTSADLKSRSTASPPIAIHFIPLNPPQKSRR